jgi:hypothetical protein
VATKKKQVIAPVEVPTEIEFIDEKVLQGVMNTPTAPGETGTAPLTRPTIKDGTKWQQ